MPEGITLKRIIDMDETEQLSSSDYVLVDSQSGGNRKYALGDKLAQVDDDLDKIPTGNYPEMTVGNADQLVSTVFTEDSTPYNFRTTGGSADVGDREYVDAIVGGTVALNQLVDKSRNSATASSNGITFTNNGDGTYTVSGTATATAGYDVQIFSGVSLGHKVLVLHGVSGGRWGYYVPLYDYNHETSAGDYNQVGMIYSITSNSTMRLRSQIWANQTVNFTMTTNVFDLTQMFGTAIADYVYGIETATAGAGVAWLKKYFPKIFDSGYIAHNPGTLVSVEGLSAHKTVGFNQWDEQWEEGSYEVDSITKKVDATRIRTKNVIPVLPSTTYYAKCPTSLGIRFVDADGNYISSATPSNNTFTTPANACGMLFSVVNTTTYNHDICINLSWDGEKDGQYEPYEEHTYPLDDSLTLRGIPKLDAQNNLYYDGDEYLPDGTVNLRYGIVDLGTLDWSYSSGFFIAYINDFKDNANGQTNNIANAVCAKYVTTTLAEVYASADKAFALGTTSNYAGRILVKDSSYTDAATFKTAMSGVYLVYELATPTTETAEPYQQVQICDDFGTEEFISTSPVPVGHNTRYAPNLRAKLEMAPDSPDGDGVYVVQQSNGENTYVPLGSTTVIQDILTRLTALENA